MTKEELLNMSDDALCKWVVENPRHEMNDSIRSLAIFLNGYSCFSEEKKQTAIKLFREAVAKNKHFKIFECIAELDDGFEKDEDRILLYIK